ncbi:hypothetical protein [Amycolatopsis thermophila]|uniref:Uncharacterized protein n=1 Tax=Amycolatopsis thermophila TaxID=206084 RepID=A0ABU0EMK4_9PSEU|nr:hypothetical protein [Amycolatopsis thermophila]MDQ0376498.1 hypothetical protein [Amycolatopsis thermophila]
MTCFTPVRGRRMRITKVNECGAPIYGDCSQVVTSGFVSVEFSPQTDEGEEITVRNANGEICVSIPACTSMTGIETTITFCNVDTDLFSLMTGQDPILGEDGEGIGFDIADIPCNEGFALELWTGVHSDQPCGVAGTEQYGYLVLPWLSSGVLADFTIEDGAVSFGVTATARSGSGWGAGPYNVQNLAAGPSPLTPPLAPDRFGRMILTTVAPPEPSCGCQPLVAPGP